ncbi:MAG: bifunctional pyr operon transcriptional regulator/uracil phosphoribosyltransferase PyrR [Nitrospinota bacterium]
MTAKKNQSHILISSNEIAQKLTRIGYEIIERNQDINQLALIGIKTRGAVMASRIAETIKKATAQSVDYGMLDVTLYRDDFGTNNRSVPTTSQIDFSIEAKKLIIVDDVLFTGRTINAAIRALFDLGRPDSIQLAVLIDRGHRELPIRPDYCGKNLPTQYIERVFVRLMETDGEDVVLALGG